MQLIIAGSRGFGYYPESNKIIPEHYDLMESKLDKLLSNTPKEDIIVLSGTARGTDKLGEEYAKNKGIHLDRYPAQWDIYGKRAGMLRNIEMCEDATHAAFFWDGVSKGTKQCIDYAKKIGLNVRVIRV